MTDSGGHSEVLLAGALENPLGRSTRKRHDASLTGGQAERLLTAREAASVLGLKPSTLYQWAYERRIPIVKLFGRSLRFRLSTIQKLIADSEQPAMRER